ncbi:HEPN domain-containing protein [Anabaena cylindrica UHCC 0172]|uniref:HEPN domain-containing protein n=1 Tax=Anabaena cylindrica TaxID=1165 RepID=UPI002B21B643|nr:HEPN domain-containing protein [Anabaena cylindrica]MEA5550812.1 HEPN domain-containing protein [Anabaena cylindrica UHCC 0172]
MNNEQQFLVQKAEDSLRAAKILTSENLHDFAASRAYYAMFYIAEAFLVGENLSFSKHSAVISKFGEIFARTGKIDPKFHRYLIDAEQIRLKGDYDRSERLNAEDAKLLIDRCEEFLKLADYL